MAAKVLLYFCINHYQIVCGNKIFVFPLDKMRALWYTALIQAMKERVVALPFCRELSVGARQ